MSAILVTFPGAPTVSEKAIEAVLTLYIILTCIQWNLSNPDTIGTVRCQESLGTDKSFLFIQVSLQYYKCPDRGAPLCVCVWNLK